MKRWSFVIASALVVHLTTVGGAGAQAMKTPGQSSSAGRIGRIKPRCHARARLRVTHLELFSRIEPDELGSTEDQC